MVNDDEKRIMLKFLNKNFPVQRIKDKDRFKRAIRLDNGQVYFLSNESDLLLLQINMLEMLFNLFSSDEITSRFVLNTYLNLRK